MRATSIVWQLVWVALVATLFTSLSVRLSAQENADSGEEVLKIWDDPDDSPKTTGTQRATNTYGDEVVLSASDDFGGLAGDNPSGSAKPPLLSVDADELTLVAVIVPVDQKDTKDRLAMVGYNGHDYELKEGSRVGGNNGVVKEIAENYVIVEEEFVNDKGEKSAKQVVLRLSD